MVRCEDTDDSTGVHVGQRFNALQILIFYETVRLNYRKSQFVVMGVAYKGYIHQVSKQPQLDYYNGVLLKKSKRTSKTIVT